MKSRLSLAWALGVSLLLLHACGGKVDSAAETCEPGQLRECGGSGVSGPCYRQCLPSGDAFSACVCNGGGPGGGGFGAYGGYPTGGNGAYGGYPTGGNGAYGGYPVGGGGYPGGGGGGPPCGACPGYKIGGLFDMKPCCSAAGSCGALVEATVGSLLGMAPGCYPTNQPGMPDPSCPPFYFSNLLDGGVSSFPGCCSGATGSCGVMIDVSSLGGPFFGCTDLGTDGGGPQNCGGSSGNCDLCVQTKCAAEVSKCMQTPACSAIIDCANACMDQACVDKCIATNPAGQPVFYAFITCVSQQCAPECQ